MRAIQFLHQTALVVLSVGGMILAVTGGLAPLTAIVGLAMGTAVNVAAQILLVGGAMFVVGLCLLALSVWIDEGRGPW